MTFLQLVNDVLTRSRESSVASVSTNTYSILIGKFVNDTKRQVEDAWNWDALATTLSISTVAGTSTLVVTGSGLRPKDLTLNNTTGRNRLRNVPLQWIMDNQQLATAQSGVPSCYAWNGNNGTDSRVELYPTPDAVYALKFNLNVAQADLSADADVLTIPSAAVVAGAYARALVERGEDGGLASSEAFGLYKGILGDSIAIESARFVENSVWTPT